MIEVSCGTVCVLWFLALVAALVVFALFVM